jgi:signal transduction histidine kinase
VEQEMVQQRIRELNLAKAQVYEGLMAAARPDGDWQPVVNAIRTGFSAQRANFWPLQQNRFQRGWSSQATQHLGVTNLLEGLEPFGAFREVIYRKRSISVTPERDGYLLEQWPDRQGVKALLAVPVICSGGEVRGVLALVNRSPTPDHPFQAFDDYERQAAEEIGRALGATLDSRERQLQAAELESRLATAMRIGAAALSGAMVMHRLMTPFALIQSSVDWLRCHPDATAAEREIHLQQIQQSCSEAVSMIQQTTTTGVAEKRPERVRALVRQAIQAVQPKLVRAAVRMELHNDCLARVFVDPYSIVGALVNLLSNALDAMGEVGTLRVVSELAVDGRTAVILICNTGPVVRDEQIAAFFQPGHSSKDRKEHLGFGLPVAKRAIEEAGGNLEMRPIAEGGVDARVTLPVAD